MGCLADSLSPSWAVLVPCWFLRPSSTISARTTTWITCHCDCGLDCGQHSSCWCSLLSTPALLSATSLGSRRKTLPPSFRLSSSTRPLKTSSRSGTSIQST
uniref:Putative secreted protein n=1 Tax=Ixodes ricinus TaxID=34613 RepID=A0A6B0UEU6_IXORI